MGLAPLVGYASHVSQAPSKHHPVKGRDRLRARERIVRGRSEVEEGESRGNKKATKAGKNGP